MPGVATIFVQLAEKLPDKLGGQDWGAKFNLIKTHNRADLILNLNLSTVITLSHINYNSSSYNCVNFLLSAAEFSKLLNNVILKNIQRALENFLASTFLPPGSGLATPIVVVSTFGGPS